MFLKSSYIVIEPRVIDYIYYSSKKVENKKTACLFLRRLISFSQDHQKVTCRLKTGSWGQGFKTGFWTRGLRFISSFLIKTQLGVIPTKTTCLIVLESGVMEQICIQTSLASKGSESKYFRLCRP